MIRLDYLEHVVLLPPSNEQIIQGSTPFFLEAEGGRLKPFQENMFW